MLGVADFQATRGGETRISERTLGTAFQPFPARISAEFCFVWPVFAARNGGITSQTQLIGWYSSPFRSVLHRTAWCRGATSEGNCRAGRDDTWPWEIRFGPGDAFTVRLGDVGPVTQNSHLGHLLQFSQRCSAFSCENVSIALSLAFADAYCSSPYPFLLFPELVGEGVLADLRNRDSGLLSRYLLEPIPDMRDCVDRSRASGASSASSSAALFVVVRSSDIFLSL